MEIDLNSDLGEGCGHDAEILKLVTSANICCGFHAGNMKITADTFILASQLGVVTGAHPGYEDREHFGRRELSMTPAEIQTLCSYQIGALDGIAQMFGRFVTYLKPHGALYNQACRDEEYAIAIAIMGARLNLPVVGLPNSPLENACRVTQIPFIREGFADRRYLPDGSLVPRSRADAFVEDPDEAAEQAERLIREQQIRTLCVHGDNPKAISFVQALRSTLLARGFTLKAFAP